MFPSVFAPFLQATEAIDCDHPSVWLRAARLTSQNSGSVEKARVLFEFVRDEIRFSPEIAYPASAVLERREGLCVPKAILFTALCRAVGIPAGLTFQGIRGAKSGSRYFLHGLTAVYLNDQWVRLDPRGGTRKPVVFDPVHGSRLPADDFAMVDYPGVFDDLPEEFMHALTRKMWADAWPETILQPPALQEAI